jgi:Sporulation lipoprotein YhcN/YlaJ (Spore_YhcN_YlaJ).
MPRYPVIQISPKELVDRAVNDAENINGVNKAYAFVSDKIIYIGLDLNEDGSQSQSAAIEREARSKIESLRSGYTVRVTTDGNTVTLIRTVNQGLAQGQAFSDFNSEVHSVVVKMTPKGSGLLNLPVKLFYILGVHSGFI